jgi:hypothetical protein
MYLVRDIMDCKLGKARALVEKFSAVAKAGEKVGLGSMRVMTDVSAERDWTVVSEVEVASLDQHTEMARKAMNMPEFQDAMKGYHDLVDQGRREISLVEQ